MTETPTELLGSALAATVLDACADGILIIDSDGIILVANQSFCELYEIPQTETVGRDFTRLAESYEVRRSEGTVAQPDWVASRALRGEAVRGLVQNVCNRTTGRSFFARYTSLPIDLPGHKGAQIVFARDITDLVIAEKARDIALVASEVAVWRVDLVLGIVQGDANVAKMFGLPPEAARGGQFEDFVRRLHPEDRHLIDRAVREATLSGGLYETEYRIVQPDGSVRHVISRGTVEVNPQGKPVERLGTLVDITARKQVEQALRGSEERLLRTNEELEVKVRERTAELERALAESVAFSYSVSHDLRAPLRAIIATSRMLELDHGADLSPEAQVLISRQLAAGRRLADLVEGLLTFSRLGREEVSRKDIDMTALASEVAEELASRNPNVKVSVQSGMRAIADPSLIRLVWQNYLENALKFSECGSVILGVDDHGAFFCQDQGCGFDMAYVGKLFEPFQRLHRDDEVSGTGIGLAHARTIVERHGGKVWAVGSLGEGATFFFSIG